MWHPHFAVEPGLSDEFIIGTHTLSRPDGMETYDLEETFSFFHLDQTFSVPDMSSSALACTSCGVYLSSKTE